MSPKPATSPEYSPRRVINAESRRSDLGGSVMSAEVITAMNTAAGMHVDMQEVIWTAGRELAKLTGNESAHVIPGAAAGIALCTLAAMVKGQADLAWGLAERRSNREPPQRVLVQASHMSPYGTAVEMVGASLRVVGSRDETPRGEFLEALSERTAAVLFVPGRDLPSETLGLEEVVELAHARQIPVIVDAAAQLPPVGNLNHFTALKGADMALFSGGKDLEGPASSGLLVGKDKWVSCCRELMYPNHHVGRAFKVGKEEVAGLVAAVRRYVQMDHGMRLQKCEDICQEWISFFSSLPGLEASRQFPNEAGQELPRVRVRISPQHYSITALGVRAQLRLLNPAVAVSTNGTDSIFLTPEPLGPGEADLVSNAVQQVLAPARAKKPDY